MLYYIDISKTDNGFEKKETVQMTNTTNNDFTHLQTVYAGELASDIRYVFARVIEKLEMAQASRPDYSQAAYEADAKELKKALKKAVSYPPHEIAALIELNSGRIENLVGSAALEAHKYNGMSKEIFELIRGELYKTTIRKKDVEYVEAHKEKAQAIKKAHAKLAKKFVNHLEKEGASVELVRIADRVHASFERMKDIDALEMDLRNTYNGEQGEHVEIERQLKMIIVMRTFDTEVEEIVIMFRNFMKDMIAKKITGVKAATSDYNDANSCAVVYFDKSDFTVWTNRYFSSNSFDRYDDENIGAIKQKRSMFEVDEQISMKELRQLAVEAYFNGFGRLAEMY